MSLNFSPVFHVDRRLAGAGNHQVPVDHEAALDGRVDGDQNLLHETLDLELAVADAVAALLEQHDATAAEHHRDRDLLVGVHLAEGQRADRGAVLLEQQRKTARRQAAQREAAVGVHRRRDGGVLLDRDRERCGGRGSPDRGGVSRARGRAPDHRTDEGDAVGRSRRGGVAAARRPGDAKKETGGNESGTMRGHTNLRLGVPGGTPRTMNIGRSAGVSCDRAHTGRVGSAGTRLSARARRSRGETRRSESAGPGRARLALYRPNACRDHGPISDVRA